MNKVKLVGGIYDGMEVEAGDLAEEKAIRMMPPTPDYIQRTSRQVISVNHFPIEYYKKLVFEIMDDVGCVYKFVVYRHKDINPVRCTKKLIEGYNP